MDKDNQKTLVPKLRFPEFRDAEEWEEKALGNIVEFTGGGTPSKNNGAYWDGNIPWISSSDISETSIHQIKISRFITKEAIRESATKLVPENSILLVSRVGVGKLAISNKSICTSQDFTNLTPFEDNLVFLAYYLKSHKKALLAFNQGMAIKGFTKDDVSKLKLFLPCSREQQKIADCLSSIDDLITEHIQKHDALKAHKKGLMQQLFPAEGETIPKLRFPEFQDAGEWEGKPLEKICKVNPPTSDLPDKFIYIDLESVVSGEVILKKEISKNNAPSRAQRLLKNGDVIYQMVRPYQKNNFFFNIDDGNDYVASTGYAQLRAYSINTFLFQLIHTDVFVKQVLSKCTGSNYPAIRASDLANVKTAVPESYEQQQIADCLTSIDDLITAQAQKIELLKAHKKGLMQQLFPTADEVDV